MLVRKLRRLSTNVERRTRSKMASSSVHQRTDLCRYPDFPPGVRASIKAGRVRAYVSASGIKGTTQVGDVRIDMRDIDSSVEFAGMSRMVRSATIRKRIQEVAGRERSEGEGATEK